MVPVKDIRKLHVTFPIPDLQKYYRSKPGQYLAHLIGYEGPGSLFAVLKSKGTLKMFEKFDGKCPGDLHFVLPVC